MSISEATEEQNNWILFGWNRQVLVVQFLSLFVVGMCWPSEFASSIDGENDEPAVLLAASCGGWKNL